MKTFSIMYNPRTEKLFAFPKTTTKSTRIVLGEVEAVTANIALQIWLNNF